MTADDLTPGTPRVTTTHPVDARTVEYGHEPCPHCPGRTTVVYVHGWRTDDGIVDRLRAVVGETHSGRCPFRPDAPQPTATGNSAFPVADDTVERAARAWHQEAERQSECQMGDWDALDPDDRARALRRMRAALAAAGAGPEVDREAVERPEVPTWDAATVERAVQAACAEAGWDWTPEPGVPSPADSMRPIVVAALSVAMPHPAENQWQSATFYGKPDGGLVLSPREAAARARRADMEIALDAIITAHPGLKHEDSQEADENYGDLLNELVDAALAARGDAAPTVTTERVEQAARAMWEQECSEGYTGSWIANAETYRRIVRANVAALGIEVTDRG